MSRGSRLPQPGLSPELRAEGRAVTLVRPLTGSRCRMDERTGRRAGLAATVASGPTGGRAGALACVPIPDPGSRIVLIHPLHERWGVTSPVVALEQVAGEGEGAEGSCGDGRE